MGKEGTFHASRRIRYGNVPLVFGLGKALFGLPSFGSRLYFELRNMLHEQTHFPPFPFSKCYENADSEMW